MNTIEIDTVNVELSPLPIQKDWILEGNPVARFKLLATSSDGTARTIAWDCTAGRFNWFYDIDESVYVVEGCAVIKDETGRSRRVAAGDTILFRAGAKAEWTVDKYIRKIAFFRNPVPKFALLGIRIARGMSKLLGKRAAASGGGSMGA